MPLGASKLTGRSGLFSNRERSPVGRTIENGDRRVGHIPDGTCGAFEISLRTRPPARTRWTRADGAL
jgi:hypothetical protein